MAEETKMKEILKNLKNVIDRRDKLQAEGKAFHPNTPKDLQVAIDTFFIHCKNMIEYERKSQFENYSQIYFDKIKLNTHIQ